MIYLYTNTANYTRTDNTSTLLLEEDFIFQHNNKNLLKEAMLSENELYKTDIVTDSGDNSIEDLQYVNKDESKYKSNEQWVYKLAQL